MTNKQAIEVLNMIETHGSLPTKAKEMAIKALEERPKGKWLRLGFGDYRCSKCEKRTALAMDYKYCPSCGAEMEVE